MAKLIHVKNLEKYQHYKDRNPPWIKLHQTLLDDYAFTCLQDASKMHLVGIWLLASRLNNNVPADPEWIARKIGATTKVNVDVLVSAGFIAVSDDASDTLADCEQVSSAHAQRGEAETETEGETEGEGRATPKEAGSLPTRKKRTRLSAKWVPTPEHVERAAGYGLNLNGEVEKFRSNAEAKGLVYESWNAAFTTWLLRSNEWAKPLANGVPKANPLDIVADAKNRKRWHAIRGELEAGGMDGDTAAEEGLEILRNEVAKR